MPWNYQDLAEFDDLIRYDTISGVVTPPVSILPGTPAPSPEPLLLPEWAWTINGHTVRMTDWSATSIAPGGFDQMRGTITADEWLGLDAGQDSRVVATCAGEVTFDGRLAVGAQVQGERAKLAAQGDKVKAERTTARLFIQSRDMDLFATLDGDPFVNASGGPIYPAYPRIDVSTGGRVRLSVQGGQLILADKSNGVGIYQPGVDFRRIAFFFDRDIDDAANNLSIRVYRANGPAGARAQVGIGELCDSSPGVEIERTWSIANMDIVQVVLYNLTDHTPGDGRAYKLSKFRINADVPLGRDNDYDIYHPDEVVSYIGSRLGWDTSGVEQSTDNALPFDWADDWASALDYIGEADDKVWGVWENQRLTYRDWGSKNWRVYLGVGAEADLIAQERFNVVRVWYETPKGNRRHVLARAVPDPLAEDNVYPYELADRQPDEVYAQSVANRLVARESRERFAGRISIFAAFDEAGVNNVYGPRAGDTVQIMDWAPGESIQLRVVETEATPNGMVLGIEQPINLASILANAVHHRKRRHHRTSGRPAKWLSMPGGGGTY